MNKHLAAMAAAGSVVFGAGAARADVLAESAKFKGNGVGGPGATPLEAVEFSYNVYDLTSWPLGPPDPPDSTRRPVFDHFILDEADEGRTIFVDASQVPGAVALLTNGANNLVDLRVGFTNDPSHFRMSDGPLPERPFLFNTVPGFPPSGQVDFAGHEITQIGVKVEKLRLNDALPGNFDFSFSVVIVPEPSVLLPFALGGLALWRRRAALPSAVGG